MKALSVLLVLSCASCSGKGTSATTDTGSDSGAEDSDTTETGETGETGDTTSGDTGETGDSGDTGDTGTPDTGDTETGGGDTDTAVETGDTATSLDIVGAVYDLDLTTATVTEPVGIGSLLTAFFSEDLLAEVESADDATITFLVGVGTARGQDHCGATSTFTADFTAKPTFFADDVDIGPIIAPGSLGSVPIALTAATLSATFSADGATSADGSVDGLIPMAVIATSPDLSSLAGCDSTGDTACVCDFIAGTGFARCEACPDGSEGCLALSMSDIEGPAVGLDLVPVAQNDCDPGCAASASNPDCDMSGW